MHFIPFTWQIYAERVTREVSARDRDSERARGRRGGGENLKAPANNLRRSINLNERRRILRQMERFQKSFWI